MLRNEDLAAAVKAGVISDEQRKALEGRAGVPPAGRDERFSFMRGFNDVFLALGVVLVTGAFLTRWSPHRYAGTGVLLAGVAVLWLISEVVVGRRKAVLPGVMAVLGIGLLASLAGMQWALSAGYDNAMRDPTGTFDLLRQYPISLWLVVAGSGGFAVLLYYLRFRLPFALFPLGVGLILTAVLAVANVFGLQTTKVALDRAGLAAGLATFAAAMAFDGSDPARLTRRADCGFWLHLAAAPFIVHPLISMLGRPQAAMTAAVATIAVVGLIGVVALIVDRRAILVASLTYLGVAAGYLLSPSFATVGIGGSATTTLAVLGAFVLFMGLGWHTLRRAILSPFKGAGWLKYLPPVQA